LQFVLGKNAVLTRLYIQYCYYEENFRFTFYILGDDFPDTG
jgi:hypothetical protein